MAKMRRTGAAPERNALRSRGCPDPDRAIPSRRDVKSRRQQEAAEQRQVTLRQHQADMLRAQRTVRELKAAGQPYEQAAKTARLARARYLALEGARPEQVYVIPAEHSERWA